MIVSRLENSSRIESLHPLFKQLFDYVKTHDLLNAPLGRIELDGDNLFINNVNPECVPADKQVLEMHRDYIDVHILLTGQETIGWKAVETLEHQAQAPIFWACSAKRLLDFTQVLPTCTITLKP